VIRRSFLTATALLPLVRTLATETPSRIRIAQIGTSHSHASGKMAALRARPDLYEVVGLTEPIAGRQARSSAQPAYAGLSWMEEAVLLADPAIQAMTVETTLGDSARAARACLQAGKHIHLDKPGADNHADFKAMRLEAAERGLIVQMGYMLRYQPAFELLFRAHREGWLGEITEINASMGKLADPTLRQELATHPGHGMFELACHLVDAIVHLLGPPSAVHAFASSTGLAQPGFPDHQLAVLEYPRALVTLRCNHGDPFGGAHRRFHVVGTKGTMEIQPLESGTGLLRLSEPRDEFKAGDNPLALTVPAGRYDREFLDFYRVLNGQAAFSWSAQHDIDVHATALRCAGVSPE